MIMTLRAGSYLEFVLEMIMFSVKTSVFVEAQICKSDPIFIFPVLFLKFDFLNMKLLFFFLNCWKGTRIQKASDSTQCSWTLTRWVRAFNLGSCVRETTPNKTCSSLSEALWCSPPDSPRCLPQFTGVILLAVGVWGKVSLEAYFSLASEESTNAPYVLIGTGAIIVIFGLFGCFATCRGSPWMLKLVGEVCSKSPWSVPLTRDPVWLFVFVCFLQYAMFLTLVFLAELVAGVSGFIFRHEVSFSPPQKKIQIYLKNEPHQLIKIYNLLCF